MKRILVVRLDRIGDVVLTTPVVQRLREAYPTAFIAMMVRPVCRELLEGNPSLDGVICYDKDGLEGGWWRTIRFARALRRYQFDTALVVHPTRRSHWIVWLAGIPQRIGYDRKDGWLLTHRLPHRKQEGAKHEAEYAMEALGVLGLLASGPLRPSVPLATQRHEQVDRLFVAAGVKPGETLVAMHPSASCISKRWMPQRFGQVADQLIDAYGARIVLVAGPGRDAHDAEAVEQAMRHRPINLAGRLSVGELACLLARCRLLISNDSGPVHIAAAVGTPVVDIFGRNQRGLSPARWGPLGEGHVVLHKEVGCRVCLAHNCDIQFKCLTELTVDEVCQAAASILTH
jgi:heptosyltransferase-2